MEAEGDARDQADLGVGRLDECVRQALLEGRVDGWQVPSELLGEQDEGRDAAARRPGEPLVEGLFALLTADLESEAQTLLEQVGAVKARAGGGDPVELGLLVAVRSSGFFQSA